MKKKNENVNSQYSGTELLEIKKLVKIIATQITINELKEIASTDKQKAIWALCEGKLTREGIAAKVGISKRAVSYFVEDCRNRGLIEEEKEKGGHPKRVIDYVPSQWKVKKKQKVKVNKTKPLASNEVKISS